MDTIPIDEVAARIAGQMRRALQESRIWNAATRRRVIAGFILLQAFASTSEQSRALLELIENAIRFVENKTDSDEITDEEGKTLCRATGPILQYLQNDLPEMNPANVQVDQIVEAWRIFSSRNTPPESPALIADEVGKLLEAGLHHVAKINPLWESGNDDRIEYAERVRNSLGC